ncbi:hypothetical protein ACOY6S_14530, partial [Enterobacter bugandensis]|uniref:hypothetical protein n=1 Tax=Enterobacter bugandensis TaxID=881260 RepID=UPI003BD35B63
TGSYASVVSVYHVPEQVFTMSPDRTVGEGQGEGISPHLSSTHTKMLFASQSKLQINVDCIFLREVTKHIVAN